MAKILSILLIALVLEAVGVVFLSGGLKEIGQPSQINTAELIAVIKRGATNRKMLAGIFFETVFFGALIYLLAKKDVSLIWPLTSLGFVITAFAAKFFLKEQVSSLRWAGVCLIVFGAALITWSEKQKEKKPTEPVSTISTNSSLR
jgi:drug/metabolite transporter (DMT)-like permease